MAGGTKALEKVKGMYIRFAPLFQMFALAYHFRISIYDAQYLCPLHVVTFTLISNLATDYIQKRRGDLASSLLNKSFLILLKRKHSYISNKPVL